MIFTTHALFHVISLCNNEEVEFQSNFALQGLFIFLISSNYVEEACFRHLSRKILKPDRNCHLYFIYKQSNDFSCIFGINKRLQIALVFWAHAILCSLCKLCECLFIPNFTGNQFITKKNSKVRSSKYYGVCFGSETKINTAKRLALLLALC